MLTYGTEAGLETTKTEIKFKDINENFKENRMKTMVQNTQ